jgi:hypothetical protein
MRFASNCFVFKLGRIFRTASGNRTIESRFGYFWRIVSFFGIRQNVHGVVMETCDPCRARSGMAGSANVVGEL